MAVNTAPINPKALAQAKRAERRRRTRRIRQGVAAGTITLFVALLSTIYVQMAGGNDPALAVSSARPAVVSTTTATSSSTGSTSSSAPPAPVTTQQS
jgi:hypothetical protein